MQINSVGPAPAAPIIPNEQGLGLPIPGEQADSGSKSFGQFLTEALGEVNANQQRAGDLVRRFATGEKMDVHQVMIAVEQASTSLSLALQVRNKITDAYQEVMRTSV